MECGSSLDVSVRRLLLTWHRRLVDSPRVQAVDLYIIRGQLSRQRVGELSNGSLDRPIDREPGQRALGGHGRNVDDFPSLATFRHMPADQLRENVDCMIMDLHDL